MLHNQNAIVPTKSGPDEVGYDLTAIEFIRRLGARTFMYDTGISVEAPEGYYTEIIPRSSISKSGYMLTNSVGIIDPTYRGTLKIVLTKVDEEKNTLPNARPLLAPFKLCQLVVRKQENLPIKVVTSQSETYRGEGGFGSTGK